MKKPTPIVVIGKTNSQRGKWVFKPLKSTVVICACGNRYIVTRKNQIQCINCTYNKTVR